ncbi:MAG TPA: ferric reductase-like transmembrane domain-containing protein [Nitrolancea sp.]|nr:ferric reductase-like transmembrane domain-containing protein [Nitrolancea sp.]
MNGNVGSLLWYVARGSGIVAYLLLTASVVLGVALSRRWYSSNWPRMVVDATHRWLTITFYLFVVIHVLTIWLDPFAHFSLLDTVVPFAGSYRPFWVSIGIIAAELGLAIGASVWVRRWIGYRAWHILHGLAYPIFVLSLLHGLGTGTDTRTSWAMSIYIVSVILVVGATAWRTATVPRTRTAVLALAVVALAGIVAWHLQLPILHG